MANYEKSTKTIQIINFAKTIDGIYDIDSLSIDNLSIDSLESTIEKPIIATIFGKSTFDPVRVK